MSMIENKLPKRIYTIVSYEDFCPYDKAKNERYSPIPEEGNHNLYNQYLYKAK